MSEMFHPPVGAEYSHEVTYASLFVEEAFATLLQHSQVYYDLDDDTEEAGNIIYTKCYDTELEDGSLCSVRLRSAPLSEKNATPSEIFLEYALVSAERYRSDDFDESDKQWQPYICLIIDFEFDGDFVIFNTDTEEELDEEAVFEALTVLRALRSNLTAEVFSGELESVKFTRENPFIENKRVISGEEKQFGSEYYPTDDMLDVKCKNCDTHNLVPMHTPN